MAFRTGQETLSTTVDSLRPANPRRTSLQLVNTDTAITVYIGATNRMTSSSGFPLIAGASYKFTTAADEEVFALSASGTPVVAWLEEFER